MTFRRNTTPLALAGTSSHSDANRQHPPLGRKGNSMPLEVLGIVIPIMSVTGVFVLIGLKG